MLTLRQVAAIAGRPGLYKVLKPTRNGVIVESIGDKPTKLVVGASEQISVLREIGIYVKTNEESVPLGKVLATVRQKYGKNLPVHTQSSGKELKSFLESVLPEFDRDRVYDSDIKKMVKWYQLLDQYLPETLDNADKEEIQTEEATAENA